MDDLSQIHVPERLDGENSAQYALRRKASAHVASRRKLVVSYGNRYTAPPARRARRIAVRAVGIRQFKRLARLHRFIASGQPLSPVYARLADTLGKEAA